MMLQTVSELSRVKDEETDIAQLAYLEYRLERRRLSRVREPQKVRKRMEPLMAFTRRRARRQTINLSPKKI